MPVADFILRDRERWIKEVMNLTEQRNQAFRDNNQELLEKAEARLLAAQDRVKRLNQYIERYDKLLERGRSI